MKFATAITIAAVAAVANAQSIAFSNPTSGSIWTAGHLEYLEWSGNCANLGAAGKNTTVDIVSGNANSVNFKGVLGMIDCTGSLTNAKLMVPADIESGQYSLRSNTQPVQYSAPFTINSASSPNAPATTPSAAPTQSPTAGTPKSAGNSLTASSALLAVAGAIAAALTL